MQGVIDQLNLDNTGLKAKCESCMAKAEHDAGGMKVSSEDVRRQAPSPHVLLARLHSIS